MRMNHNQRSIAKFPKAYAGHHYISPIRSHDPGQVIAEVAGHGQVTEEDGGRHQTNGDYSSGHEPGVRAELSHQDAGADGAENQGHLADGCGCLRGRRGKNASAEMHLYIR